MKGRELERGAGAEGERLCLKDERLGRKEGDYGREGGSGVYGWYQVGGVKLE